MTLLYRQFTAWLWSVLVTRWQYHSPKTTRRQIQLRLKTHRPHQLSIQKTMMLTKCTFSVLADAIAIIVSSVVCLSETRVLWQNNWGMDHAVFTAVATEIQETSSSPAVDPEDFITKRLSVLDGHWRNYELGDPRHNNCFTKVDIP